MKLFHLTDIHCGNKNAPFRTDELVNALEALSGDFSRDDCYLVVSGDVTYQGSLAGYKEAQAVIEKCWLSRGGAASRIVACPGNHDICENSFRAFDKFTYAVRRDGRLSFENKSTCVLRFGDVLFAVVNSAYHRDHKFGLVDVAQLVDELKVARVSECNTKIAIVHHHLVGVDANDLSTLRNALPLLEALQKHGFELVLHGHRHSLSEISVGPNAMAIRAGRSLNFETPGYVNGMSIHERVNGTWEAKNLFLSKDIAAVGLAGFAAQGRE
ncbi:metallophosphoesterase family protein [Paraburkholderia sabiae]|uniref:Metallophosphoesterase n=1 Tax=Paraburkholderia sabiae TaxID=273251 RepID=A0ABU9QPS3_9BURK|nr:metallophosphoesterase [Paraburkholderia sabiae]WJZ74386.1 metallophosphoesterase [Paraburkholderia sabiae]CAD6562652.1 3',5'-cyclic adenosine monophosphate phosphodiesterase CpdA [Paraburkholderia sabiae]